MANFELDRFLIPARKAESVPVSGKAHLTSEGTMAPERRPEIISLGKDGQEGTEDDISSQKDLNP